MRSFSKDAGFSTTRALAGARIAAAALVAFALTEPARAQDAESIGAGRDFHVGGYAGVFFAAPEAFAAEEGSSDTRAFFGARFGYEIMRWMELEGSLTIHPGEEKEATLDLFPPENGTLRYRLFHEAIAGYPFGSDEVRVVFHLPRKGAHTTGRLVAGAGWMWGKDIGFLLAGAGVLFGGERVAGVIDFERWWFDVPFTDVEETYADGLLVSRREEPGGESESPTALRFGVNWRL